MRGNDFDITVAQFEKRDACIKNIIILSPSVSGLCDELLPKTALQFWFFGDFRCGVLLFMVIYGYSRYI